MTRLTNRYNWGSTLSKENPDLYRQLNDVYTDISMNANGKSNKVNMTMDPPADSQINKNFDIGDIWVRPDTDSAWMLTSRTTAEAVTWKLIT